ncbi:hypothetical protein [Atlantibacter subterraneus]|uniref:hypothetical protein n=1 Tax=Atlantibacter subterraneus TaxID=255519 RepID=UPI0028B21D05|nr:hypothetical protein [Atlantibacter subterranea]
MSNLTPAIGAALPLMGQKQNTIPFLKCVKRLVSLIIQRVKGTFSALKKLASILQILC